LLAENVPGVIYLCRDDENFTNIFISANIEKITGYRPRLPERNDPTWCS